ncbi:hypothetical protein B0O99DRAFT_633564 [Bisporella sp. PMI_857]|nr:hypothetical protein B0O99DRAFT_633564 [Bisporella sp. PMI_857]
MTYQYLWMHQQLHSIPFRRTLHLILCGMCIQRLGHRYIISNVFHLSYLPCTKWCKADYVFIEWLVRRHLRRYIADMITAPPIPPTPIPTPVPPTEETTVVPSPIEKSKGLPIGPIIGGVIGGLAVIVAAAAVGIWFCLKKRRHMNDAPVHQPFQTQLPQPQQGYGPYSAQEKIPVSASTSPISPCIEQQQQQWASSPPRMSPSGSPSPIYHPQPIPRPYSYQQPSQQVRIQQHPTQLP